MPSKSKAIERTKSEYAAQKARSAALKYLSDTGSGPSTQELAREEMQRKKYKNQTTTKIQTYLNTNNPILNSYTTNSFSDPRVRDNTLQVLAKRNTINHKLKPFEITANENIHVLENSVQTNTSSLPKGWKKLFDPNSGDYYYWNEITNETTWDQPIFTSTSPQSLASSKSISR